MLVLAHIVKNEVGKKCRNKVKYNNDNFGNMGGYMAKERAFLTYIGNRKWRKLKKANIPPEKSFLVYLGNRKWKRRKVEVSRLFN